MKTPDSTYAKPFLTVPEQIRLLRRRGMDCGGDEYAADVLERYGYYRLSGYWHIYRDRPTAPAAQYTEEGREIRLDTFVSGTTLVHVVALYLFDQELRKRLGDSISVIETAFRFFIGHRLGRVDKFAHRKPELLGAAHEAKPKAVYDEWLLEYDRHEKRVRGDFVMHFRRKYGPHLPIWVATEVMSFGVLSSLYGLMKQGDQEIIAARFRVLTADGRGDRGAMGNWLNNLRNVRNICAHYGRLWNRVLDVLIDAPGTARRDASDSLASLADDGTNNRLYGVLLIMRHLLLSIEPNRADVVDLADFIEEQSLAIGFGMEHLGFPDNWRDNPIWSRAFVLDRSAMLAASLTDRAESMTAAETRKELTSAEVSPSKQFRTAEGVARARNAAQRSLLRTYVKYGVVIEIELGKTKFYPVFQFRGGKIVDAVAEINRTLMSSCGDLSSTGRAKALLDWWQTPHPSLPRGVGDALRSPVDLLSEMSERDFAEAVHGVNAVRSLVVPGFQP